MRTALPALFLGITVLLNPETMIRVVRRIARPALLRVAYMESVASSVRRNSSRNRLM